MFNATLCGDSSQADTSFDAVLLLPTVGALPAHPVLLLFPCHLPSAWAQQRCRHSLLTSGLSMLGAWRTPGGGASTDSVCEIVVLETVSPSPDGSSGHEESRHGEQRSQQSLGRRGDRETLVLQSVLEPSPGGRCAMPVEPACNGAGDLGWPPASGPGVNPYPSLNSPSRGYPVSHK